jgi:hypothetical protein
MKYLVILAVLSANLLWRPSVSEAPQPSTHTKDTKADNNKQVVPPTHVVIDPPLPASTSKPEPAQSDPQAPEMPLPRFERPEWVLVYITAVYVLIAWLTLRAIKKQAKSMAQQVIDAQNASTAAATVATNTLNAMGRQADLMEDTAKRQLRAYLCVSKGRLNFTKEGELEPQLHLVNGGQTPAYEVRSWIDTAVREHPSFGPLQLAGPKNIMQAVGIIPPQGEEIMVSRKVPKEVAEGTFLQTRFKVLYVYGEITYKDAFGQDRYTKFRLIFGGPAGCRRKTDKNGEEMGYLSMDSGGNEAN